MKLIKLQQLCWILTLAISSSNAEKRIFVGDQFGEMQILSAKTVNSVSLATIQAHKCTQVGCRSAGITYILDLHQNDLIATASDDGSVKIWKSLLDPPYISLQRQLLGHSSQVDSLSMYNDMVLMSASGDGTVKLWNIETGNCLHTLNVCPNNGKHAVYGLAALPDGRIVTGDSDMQHLANATSNIKIWDLEDSSSELIATLPTLIFQFELIGDGAYLAVPTRKNCKACNTTANANHDRGSIYLYFLNDPSQFFVLGDTGLPNDQDLSDYPGYFHTDSVFSLISISDNLFASGSSDKSVKVWNLTDLFEGKSPRAPLTLKSSFGKVNDIDYDSNAKHLISGAEYGLINTYSMEEGTAQYGRLLGSYDSGQAVFAIIVADITGEDESIVNYVNEEEEDEDESI